jgi:hypothetical protein
MNIPDINSLRDDLLIELARLKANNASPADVMKICSKLRTEYDWSSDWELARSAGWLLVRNQPPLAKKTTDSDRPGAMLLALTAAGKAEASRLNKSRQPLSLMQRVKAFSRSDWIALGAFVVSVIALFKPGS